jgi:hypothetical protein
LKKETFFLGDMSMKANVLRFLVVIAAVFLGGLPSPVEGMDQVKELPPCLQENRNEKVQFKVYVQLMNADRRIMKSSTIALRGVVDDQAFDIASNRFGEPEQTPVRSSAYDVTFTHGCMTKASFVYEGIASWEIPQSSGNTLNVSSELNSSGSYQVSDLLRESIRSCDIKISINFEYARTPGENPEIIGEITCLTKQLVIKNKLQN